jgi:hypothetical protein
MSISKDISKYIIQLLPKPVSIWQSVSRLIVLDRNWWKGTVLRCMISHKGPEAAEFMAIFFSSI